jgi:xylan 1,4-beta-xylosidase
VGVKLGGVLTWAFTFPGTPYFAWYRTLATNGINLPVLGAFKLLGSLTGSRLPFVSSGALALSDILANSVRGQPAIDGMAALDGDALRVLVWNYHDDLVAAPVTPVTLSVMVPKSYGASVSVSHTRVDEAHGDAYTAWVAQGSPANPSLSELAALEQAMDPSPLVPDEILAVAADGSVSVSFELPRFAVSLVTITPHSRPREGSSTSEAGSEGACACRAGKSGNSAAALLALGALAVVVVARRRNAC